MRKNLLLVLLAIASFAFATKSIAQTTESIAGNYIGKLSVVVGEADPIESENQIINIATGASDDQINLSIKSLTLPMIGSIGDIDVPNVPVTKDGDDLIFSIREHDMVVNTPLGSLTITLNLDGMIGTDGTLDIEMRITQAAMPTFLVTVTYEGTKATATSLKKQTAEFSIYPTITNDFITVNGIESGEYIIYSATGAVARKGMIEGAINVSDLNNGVYLLNIENQTVRFIKK